MAKQLKVSCDKKTHAKTAYGADRFCVTVQYAKKKDKYCIGYIAECFGSEAWAVTFNRLIGERNSKKSVPITFMEYGGVEFTSREVLEEWLTENILRVYKDIRIFHDGGCLG